LRSFLSGLVATAAVLFPKGFQWTLILTATTKADNAFWDELMALVRRQRFNPREDAYLKDYE
jgi:hypothetical protein